MYMRGCSDVDIATVLGLRVYNDTTLMSSCFGARSRSFSVFLLHIFIRKHIWRTIRASAHQHDCNNRKYGPTDVDNMFFARQK